MTETRAAKMGVKVGEAICDFIRLRHSRPLPRTRFCMPERAAVRDVQLLFRVLDGAHSLMHIKPPGSYAC